MLPQKTQKLAYNKVEIKICFGCNAPRSCLEQGRKGMGEVGRVLIGRDPAVCVYKSTQIPTLAHLKPTPFSA